MPSEPCTVIMSVAGSIAVIVASIFCGGHGLSAGAAAGCPLSLSAASTVPPIMPTHANSATARIADTRIHVFIDVSSLPGMREVIDRARRRADAGSDQRTLAGAVTG